MSLRLPEDIACARRSVLLRGLADDALQDVLASATVQDAPHGTTLFVEGDPAHSVYVVLEGWIKLCRLSPSGAEAVVGVFARGESFAEAVAFRNATYPVNAEAVTDARLLRLDVATLLDGMRRRPDLGPAILAAAFSHLHALVQQVEQLKARTGAQRLAAFLVDLCPADAGACTVTLPYDKALLAGRLGIQPESLSRAFGRLRDAGVQVRQTQASIDDVARLRAFVDQDRAEFWRKAEG
jgi:CRP-like cAMP-binding protein